MNAGRRATAHLVWQTSPIPGSETTAWLRAGDLDEAAVISHPSARTRFLVARGLLRRTVQAACPDADPGHLRIRATPLGRPTACLDGLDIYLSVSHTRGLAAAAASTEAPVGVDVESLDRVGLPDVAAWLTPDERGHLGDLPQDLRRTWLLRRWVAKEGAIKVGGGAGDWTRRALSTVDAHVVHRPGPSVGTRVAEVDWHVLDGGFIVAVVVGHR